MTCYVVIISSAENQIVVYAFFIDFLIFRHYGGTRRALSNGSSFRIQF